MDAAGNVESPQTIDFSPGHVDPTFGSGGTASVPVVAPVGFSVLSTVLAEGDGKIVVTGGYVDPNFGSSGEAVARFNADGSPDPTFGNGGQVLVPDFSLISNFNPNLLPAALEGDKIILAGEIGGDVALMRLNADGGIDTTFGDDGTAIASFDFEPTGMLIQGDGKILVAGSGDGATTLARFNGDGSVNTSFGGDGQVVSDIHPGRGVIVSNSPIALQPDGKIIVAGSDGASSSHLALVPIILMAPATPVSAPPPPARSSPPLCPRSGLSSRPRELSRSPTTLP